MFTPKFHYNFNIWNMQNYEIALANFTVHIYKNEYQYKIFHSCLLNLVSPTASFLVDVVKESLSFYLLSVYFHSWKASNTLLYLSLHFLAMFEFLIVMWEICEEHEQRKCEEEVPHPVKHCKGLSPLLIKGRLRLFLNLILSMNIWQKIIEEY